VNELLLSLKDTDESYTISILEDSTEISLSANQYSGVVRGLSTLAQLIKASKDQQSLHEIAHIPLSINDSPRYSYRGLMLDTSRRYFKVETILEVIDSLAAGKFNVFHWHIVDDDSFPL
jgi:hexosaminidase